MQDVNEAVAEGAQGLVVGIPGGAAGVVEGAGGGLAVIAAKAQRKIASASRLSRACRASTTRRVPDARVIGDVPA